MDLQQKPSWSKKKLHKLGKALVDGSVPPDGCPTYNEVMLWHHELASEVAGIIDRTAWTSPDPLWRDVQLRVSSRGKTIDTLVQKLQRSSFGLEDIQDIAGVRVDADFTLTQQTIFADLLADHFEVDARGKRDLRDKPHSGYRAFHLWVRCPAGRVEIQIRTAGQSEWANTYERLGDVLGRGIRYGEPADNERLQGATTEAREVASEVVAQMHDLSSDLQALEKFLDLTAATARFGPEYFDEAESLPGDEAAHRELRDLRKVITEAHSHRESAEKAHRDYIDAMREIRRKLDQLEEV